MESNEDEEEEEDSKAGAVMALLWLGILEAAFLTILVGFIVGFVRSAQKGTFSMDQLLGVLPWLILLAIGSFLVGWVILVIVRNLISMFRKGAKEQGDTEK